MTEIEMINLMAATIYAGRKANARESSVRVCDVVDIAIWICEEAKAKLRATKLRKRDDEN